MCLCVLRTTFCTVLISWLYEASSSSPEAFVFTLSWCSLKSYFWVLLVFITIFLLTLLFGLLLEVKACPQLHNASLTCTITMWMYLLQPHSTFHLSTQYYTTLESRSHFCSPFFISNIFTHAHQQSARWTTPLSAAHGRRDPGSSI